MTRPLPAGDFGAWLAELAAALRGEGDTDVACGSCVGCCSSSQFILIEADERDALAHIPSELLFPAPRMPKGNMLLGYDERGRCPMLSDHGCTIYAHRPRTCRTYDCRVFPAAGVYPDEPEKTLVAERARQWEFSYADDGDRALHDAVLAAARAIQLAESAPATPVAVRAARSVIERA
ncbi:MAG: YkgJ family cysteine cluster protein [Actinobacteria bacterium]|nr:YkgJ family cysteine cluster protein [Actinomycetota bacterium]